MSLKSACECPRCKMILCTCPKFAWQEDRRPIPAGFEDLYKRSKKRPVIKVPANFLRMTCKPVDVVSHRIKLLVDRMVEACRLEKGCGLAANQLGMNYRVIVFKDDEGSFVPIVNPEIVGSSSIVEADEEGCLSQPGLYGQVTRPVAVNVVGKDIVGRPLALDLFGVTARTVQHEVDHLDGILFTDKADPYSLIWRK